MKNQNLALNISFEDSWNKYIMPLQGKEIALADGGKNKILSVTNNGITRLTSKAKNNSISIEPFIYAFEKVINGGYISRDEINDNFSRCSSGVVAILKEIPFISLVREPKLGLRLNIEKL